MGRCAGFASQDGEHSVTGSLAEDFERDQKQMAEMLANWERNRSSGPHAEEHRRKKRDGGHRISLWTKLRRKAGTALDQKAGLLTAHEQHLKHC